MDIQCPPQNQNPTVGSVVDNVDVIKKKFEKLFPCTQKLQEISSLDNSPILIFSKFFFKTLNKSDPNRKEVYDLLLEKWKECPIVVKEFCLKKSVQLATDNRNRQNVMVKNICLSKNEIVDTSTNIPSLNISGDATHFLFAQTKDLLAKYCCRKPGCSTEFKQSSHRESHERNLHKTIRHWCSICNVYADNWKTIENHNIRYHGAPASTDNQRVIEHVVPLVENKENDDVADLVTAPTNNQRVIEHVVPLEDDVCASSIPTTNEELNDLDDWDDWEPDAFDYSNFETTVTHDRVSLLNRSFKDAVDIPSVGDVAIEIDPPIPIVVNHPAEVNVCNVPVKLSSKERILAAIDGRDIQWFVLDISALDRCLIGLHDDMKKLLSYINAQSHHQFKESDIMIANGVFLGTVEKCQENLIPAMENTSKLHPGKVHVCVTLPYRTTTSSMNSVPQAVSVPSALPSSSTSHSSNGNRSFTEPQSSRQTGAVPKTKTQHNVTLPYRTTLSSLNSVPQAVFLPSALPSSSTSHSSNGNRSFTEPQSESTASSQTGTATEATTPHTVLRLYSVGIKVTFNMLADFVSQCGPLVWMQTETSKTTNVKTIFVELAVKRSVAQAFVNKWWGKCRLNNSNFVMQMSHLLTIHDRSDKAKEDMIAYRASKLSRQ